MAPNHLLAADDGSLRRDASPTGWLRSRVTFRCSEWPPDPSGTHARVAVKTPARPFSVIDQAIAAAVIAVPAQPSRRVPREYARARQIEGHDQTRYHRRWLISRGAYWYLQPHQTIGDDGASRATPLRPPAPRRRSEASGWPAHTRCPLQSERLGVAAGDLRGERSTGGGADQLDADLETQAMRSMVARVTPVVSAVPSSAAIAISGIAADPNIVGRTRIPFSDDTVPRNDITKALAGVVDLGRGADLFDAALVEHGDAVGDIEGPAWSW